MTLTSGPHNQHHITTIWNPKLLTHQSPQRVDDGAIRGKTRVCSRAESPFGPGERLVVNFFFLELLFSGVWGRIHVLIRSSCCTCKVHFHHPGKCKQAKEFPASHRAGVVPVWRDEVLIEIVITDSKCALHVIRPRPLEYAWDLTLPLNLVRGRRRISHWFEMFSKLTEPSQLCWRKRKIKKSAYHANPALQTSQY